MQITLSAPSKTFLVGEYLALSGGPSLVATTGQRFQLVLQKVNEENPLVNKLNKAGIHPESPAGRWALKYSECFENFDFSFVDPYNGAGGMGASSAQFVMFYVWTKMHSENISNWNDINVEELWRSYQSLFEGQSTPPSGADVVAQYVGGICLFQSEPFKIKRYSWNFEEQSFCILKTKNKIATHNHLSELKVDSFESLLPAVNRVIESFEEESAFDFTFGVNDFYEALKAKKLVARETFSLVHQFHKSGLALSVKGCGAMGADVILVVCEKKNLLAVKNLAQVVGLKWIADSNEIESGLEVHFDFDVNIKNKESQDEDVVVQ